MFIAADNKVALNSSQAINDAGYDPLILNFTLDELRGKSVKSGRAFEGERRHAVAEIQHNHLVKALREGLSTRALIDVSSSDTLGDMWGRCLGMLEESYMASKLEHYIASMSEMKSVPNLNLIYSKMVVQIDAIKQWLRADHGIKCKTKDLCAVIFSKDSTGLYDAFKLKFFHLSYNKDDGKTFKVDDVMVNNKLDINDMALVLSAFEHRCPLMTTNINMELQAKSSFATFCFSDDLLFIDANVVTSHNELRHCVESAISSGRYRLSLADSSPRNTLFSSPQRMKRTSGKERGSSTDPRKKNYFSPAQKARTEELKPINLPMLPGIDGTRLFDDEESDQNTCPNKPGRKI